MSRTARRGEVDTTANTVVPPPLIAEGVERERSAGRREVRGEALGLEQHSARHGRLPCARPATEYAEIHVAVAKMRGDRETVRCCANDGEVGALPHGVRSVSLSRCQTENLHQPGDYRGMFWREPPLTELDVRLITRARSTPGVDREPVTAQGRRVRRGTGSRGSEMPGPSAR